MIFKHSLEECSMRQPIRVGIIGLGRAGLLQHIPALKELPQCFKILGACDLVKERRDPLVRDFPEIHFYRQIEDMLDDPELDLFVVALPSTEHLKTTLAILRRKNRWAVVEMPLAPSLDKVNIIRSASDKAGNRVIPLIPELFDASFQLASLARKDTDKLGTVFDVRVSDLDYLRRDDWQAIKRKGGGAVARAGTARMLQTIRLLGEQPTQLWGNLKRVAALGDAEDYIRILMRGRTVNIDLEVSGGELAPERPLFEIRGDRGRFFVMPGATTGTFRVIDPEYKLPRRRSSVSVPPLEDLHEKLPIVDIPLSLPSDEEYGARALWLAIYSTVTFGTEFPVTLENIAESTRYLELIYRASPFANHNASSLKR